MSEKRKKTGLILTAIGSLLGIAFCAMLVWADVEANLFRYGVTAEKNLPYLDCPILINGEEESSIVVRLKNNRDKEMTPYIRAYVSEEHITLDRQSTTALTIQPGDRAEIIWKIYPEDAVYDQFVFFRVFLHDDYPYPSRYGSCGVWVTNIPGLTGPQISRLSLGITLLLLLAGNTLLVINPFPDGEKRREIATGLKYLSGLVLINLILALLGFWLLLSVIILVVAVIVGIILLIRSMSKDSLA
jgi:hypothetical protein